MTFDPSSLSNFMLILTAWGGAFLAALWLSLIIWTYRDIRSRARDPFGRILAVLVVAVLFLPGIVVYLILRPQRTLDDEYQHTLEEEALLRSIEDTPVCPGCGRRAKKNWEICPNCHTKLKKICHHCGELMELPWNLCPYCGTPTPGTRRDDLSLDEAMASLSPTPPDEKPDDDDENEEEDREEKETTTEE
ncbi:MAG: zinc ribbon domain-containing protein [Chloroflexota bacterium]|nr:zinc ribbon domain-containing protein [Chloroflexota bacterium]